MRKISEPSEGLNIKCQDRGSEVTVTNLPLNAAWLPERESGYKMVKEVLGVFQGIQRSSDPELCADIDFEIRSIPMW